MVSHDVDQAAFGEPSELSLGEAFDILDVRAASDDDGNGMATWHEWDDGGDVLWFSRYDAAGAQWSAPVKFGTGISILDDAPTPYFDAAGDAHVVWRVDEGAIGPDTAVFDNTIQTVGALRDGRWEVPASRSWHGPAFFSTHSARTK